MSKVKVSVIIPVYNAENHLRKCLNSITKQTLADIEIFCIDDGSTDNSWEIIQAVADRDARVVAIQQENQGAAIARNKGLERANGEYIGFVDSDDYVDKTYFEYLYNTAINHDADIARAYIKTETESQDTLGRPDSEYEDYFYNQVLKSSILDNKLNQRYVMWLAIYSRKMLSKYKIVFPDEIRTGQDVLFNIQTGYYANKIVYTDVPTYYHRNVRKGSLMTDYIYSDSGLLSRSISVRENIAFLNSKPDYDKSIYISHMSDALNFIRERVSHNKSEDVAKRISTIVTGAWADIKYKDDIRKELEWEDSRYARALDDEKELFRYIREVASSSVKDITISVVIPVYNQEKYLSECIKRIQAQTVKNIEIICVNDGSVDSSQTILERFAYRDKRIKVINKENGGVSTARNAGFDIARGKYIIFLDSDDFFEPKLLESLYTQLEKTKADIAVCNFKSYYDSMQKFSEPRIDFKPFRKKIVSYETNPDNIFDGLTLMFWNKMFRTDFLQKSGIRNDESLHRAQDIDFVGRALVSTKKIVVVDESLVCYRTDTEESNVRRLHKYPDDVISALSGLKQYLEKRRLYEKTKVSFTKIAVDHILANLYFTEIYPVHKEIYGTAKKFLQSMDLEIAQLTGSFPDKTYNEITMLLKCSYEEWLRFRISDLRDDREAKHISYLLEEYKRKYEEELQKRKLVEQSKIWQASKPIRKIRSKFRRV